MKRIILTAFMLCLLSPTLVMARNNSVSTEKRQYQEKAQELKEANAENKDALKTQVLSRAKTLAIKSVDKLILKYEHFSDVVEKLPNVSDQNKAEYKIKINAEIEKLKAKKAEINAATTSAEVKAIMETVKAQARQSNQAVKLMVAAIKKTHLESIIEKINTVVIRLETQITESQNLEIDAAECNNLINEAKSFISLAQNKLAENSISESKENLVLAKNTLSKLTGLLVINEEE